MYIATGLRHGGALLCVLMLVYVFSAVALASPIDKVFLFGDSLSDTGNVFILTGSDPSSSVPFGTRYSNGRFSNGYVWADYLAEAWNIDLKPGEGDYSLAAGDSVNFAYGGSGSQNGFNSTPGLFQVPGAWAQVGMYGSALTAAGIGADPDALHIIWTGSNDYLIDPSLGVTPDPATSVSNVVGAVTDLYSLGARRVLLLNLPDLGQAPIVKDAGMSAIVSTVIGIHNELLDDAVDALRQALTDVSLQLFDAHALIDDVIADPEAYGLSPDLSAGPAAPCLLDPSPVNCSPILFETDRFFWDEQHFSTAVHEIVARAVVPLPASPILLLGGLVGLVAVMRRRSTDPRNATG